MLDVDIKDTTKLVCKQCDGDEIEKVWSIETWWYRLKAEHEYGCSTDGKETDVRVWAERYGVKVPGGG